MTNVRFAQSQPTTIVKTTTDKRLYKERRVRLWILSDKSLTENEALDKFHCRRLASVICKMRKEGVKIETKMIYTNGDSYARYSLKKTKKENRIKALFR